MRKIHVSDCLMSLYMALEAAAVAVAGYFSGLLFSSFILHQSSGEIGGLWCMVSALVVLQSLLQETKEAGLVRIRGSFVGALVSGALCEFAGYGFWQLSIAVAVTTFIMRLTGQQKATRLASATAGIIVAIGIMHPQDEVAWLNAFSRFCESVLGVSLAFLAVSFSHLIGVRKQVETPG